MKLNPLLEPGLPRFDRIRPELAEAAVDLRLGACRALIGRIEQGACADATETVTAEVRADDDLALVWSTVRHLHAVRNTPQWREAFTACLEKITAFHTARGQNRAVMACWQAVADAGDFGERPAAFRRMVELELLGFRLSGVDLEEPARSRFAQLSLELSRLANRFGNHVLDATEQWFVDFTDPSALAGLPDAEREILAQKARDAGREGWRADLSHPCYRAIMTYAEDRELRERFYQAHCTRASNQGPQAGRFDNEAIVTEMLRLRHEQAALLGYASYAEMSLEQRMASSVDEVADFLLDLTARARPAAQAQFHALGEFARGTGGPDRLEPWDIAYYSEQMRRHTLGLDQQHLKPYFELESTLDALFGLAGALFGIGFEHDPDAAVWHPEVRYYRISGLAADCGLYLDLYARGSKQGGAWMDVCRQRRRLPGESLRGPVAFLTCNFAAPSPGQPSLLTHDDVVTLFHEFGHCLHHLLTEVDWPPVAGISGVEWDAVELPSQLFEGWVWEPEFLKRHARHYQTGEALPDRMINALVADRKFLGALALTRQIEFALTDLELHRGPVDDPVAVMRRVHEQVAVTPMPDYNRYLMSFSHLFDGGYAAGYYSYLWAERLARDAFDEFRHQGLYDRALGTRLRAEILAVGGSRGMADSWQAFIGRAPRLDPLLEAYGVAP
ncbi:MAG: oligopeptidase A [Wenzhouxiangellaceae bacterium]